MGEAMLEDICSAVREVVGTSITVGEICSVSELLLWLVTSELVTLGEDTGICTVLDDTKVVSTTTSEDIIRGVDEGMTDTVDVDTVVSNSEVANDVVTTAGDGSGVLVWIEDMTSVVVAWTKLDVGMACSVVEGDNVCVLGLKDGATDVLKGVPCTLDVSNVVVTALDSEMLLVAIVDVLTSLDTVDWVCDVLTSYMLVRVGEPMTTSELDVITATGELTARVDWVAGGVIWIVVVLSIVSELAKIED